MHTLAGSLLALKQPDQFASSLKGNTKRLRLAQEPDIDRRILVINSIAIGETLWAGQNTATFVISKGGWTESHAFGESAYCEGLTFDHGLTCSMKS
jgi:hypothetical protein